MDKAESIEILEKCNAICHNTLMETLSIKFIEVGEAYLVAEMPVDSRVHQPDGVLHGGAMVALAESVGSAAAMIHARDKNIQIRGLQITANHLKSKRSGMVRGVAKAKHLGRTTQLWSIDILDEDDKLISSIQLTTMALSKPGA